MKAESKFFRVILVSPWFLLIFFAIPLVVVLSLLLHVQLPFAGPKPLLVNNIFFALFVAFRLVRYLAGSGKTLRYGSFSDRPGQSITLAHPASAIREALVTSGFSFDAEGCYGEKRDSGYIGTTVLYGGLLIILTVGSWDNLRQFSGVLLDGMGPSTDLNKSKSYRHITKGPLASVPDSLPLMQIDNQILPDTTYPMGATEISFILTDGIAKKRLLIPRVPVSYGDYDIYMAKLVFEPQIVIKSKDQKTLFDEFVRLDPLVQKRGVFSFYGLFHGTNLGGGVYYQPEKSTMMVVMSNNEKKVVADMMFQVDQQVTKGDYTLSCAKMGQWSEIHVVRRRHKGLLVLGGIIAVVGLLMRIIIKPQRVWLEETANGSTIWVSDKETKKLLKIELTR
jgi:hypothetical protein